MKRSRLLFLFWLAAVVLLVVFRFSVPVTNMLTWDVFGYYLYLPASFIYRDLALHDMSWLNQLIETYQPTATLYQAIQIENGNWVMKYSMGMAFLYAPFFFLAHLLASPLGFEADGLSAPYQVSAVIGGLFYAAVGLWYFGKVLLRFFDEKTAAIVFALIVLGTNYFQLTAFDGTLLSHNMLFMLYAMLVWNTLEWHRQPAMRQAVIIGLLCGFIALVRPSEVVCVLIPLLWGVYDRKSIVQKAQLLRKHKNQLLALSAAAFVAGMPQLIYWYFITGDVLFYSYTNPGEGFEFLSPYTVEYLLSYRKGWLVYTPLMFFAFAGFIFLYRRKRELFWAILLFVAIDLWIVSSWTTWWYAGGSFSARSMVPAYVLLAIPLGMVIEWARAQKKWLLRVSALMAVFLVVLNLFQTWQFHAGIITKQTMTGAYYWKIFGRTSVSEKDKALLLIDRSTSEFEEFTNRTGYLRSELYKNDFREQKTIAPSGDSLGVFVMDANAPFSPGPTLPYHAITKTDHAWLVASVRIFIPEDYNEALPLLVLTFNHKGKSYKYRSTEKYPLNWNKGGWTTVSMDYLTPEVRSINDTFQMYVWHRGQSAIAIDDLKLEAWKK